MIPAWLHAFATRLESDHPLGGSARLQPTLEAWWERAQPRAVALQWVQPASSGPAGGQGLSWWALTRQSLGGPFARAVDGGEFGYLGPVDDTGEPSEEVRVEVDMVEVIAYRLARGRAAVAPAVTSWAVEFAAAARSALLDSRGTGAGPSHDQLSGAHQSNQERDPGDPRRPAEVRLITDPARGADGNIAGGQAVLWVCGAGSSTGLVWQDVPTSGAPVPADDWALQVNVRSYRQPWPQFLDLTATAVRGDLELSARVGSNAEGLTA